MLVIDDNRSKLLKMKEKMLEVSSTNREEILSDYRDLVIQIDHEIYNKLIAKIKDTDYNNLPLEEELRELSLFEDNYNAFDELRHSYIQVYEKYATDELELSPLDNILIDNIRKRISDIQGYLINLKNLESNKTELSRLSQELVNEDRRATLTNDKIIILEDELINNLLKAEGRLHDDKGQLIYTSAVSEYKQNGFDLKELLNDQNKLDLEVSKAYKEVDDSQELLDATYICYQNAPNEENRQIYIKNHVEMIVAKYKLSLIEILQLICDKDSYYDLAKNKRYHLLDLIKERRSYMNSLGIKVYIDPFDRIKIKEQLEIINSLGDNSAKISEIRETISYLTGMIEQTSDANKELLLSINSNLEMFRDNTNVTDIMNNLNISATDEAIDELPANKVVKIFNPSDDFMADRVREKTKGVIRRVNEMFNMHFEEQKEVSTEIPDLLIENVSTPLNDNLFINEGENVFDESDSYQSEAAFPTDVFIPEETQIDEQVYSETNTTDSTIPKQVFDDINHNLEVDDSSLFQEVEPFTQTQLFDDRSDDGVFTEEIKENNSLDYTMPDAFWTVKDDTSNDKITDVERTPSFDEQINALIQNDDYERIRKK